MSESLYCPHQSVLSEEGKDNWDKIRWEKEEYNEDSEQVQGRIQEG